MYKSNFRVCTAPFWFTAKRTNWLNLAKGIAFLSKWPRKVWRFCPEQVSIPRVLQSASAARNCSAILEMSPSGSGLVPMRPLTDWRSIGGRIWAMAALAESVRRRTGATGINEAVSWPNWLTRADLCLKIQVLNWLLVLKVVDTNVAMFPIFLPGGLTAARQSDRCTYIGLKYWLCLSSALLWLAFFGGWIFLY